MIRRLRAGEWAFDAALAAFIVVVALPFAWLDPGPVWGFATIALSAGGVVMRRASPAIALAAVGVSALLQMAAGVEPNTVNLAQLFVLYACAAFGSRLIRRLSLGVAVIGAVVAAIYIVLLLSDVSGPDEVRSRTLLIVIVFGFILATLVCSWLLGLARHLVLRARAAAVAQQIAQVQAQRDRELTAIEHERGRVAREMHDVLAHSLVSIAMLADGTRISVRADPDEAEDLARTIGDLARESVTDVRRLLAELRHGQGDAAAPTIAELPTAIGRAEALGLRVDRSDTGEQQPLSPGASLAVYRVVNECLTNALRHGDVRAPVIVRLDWRPGALRVTVRNRVGRSASSARGSAAEAQAIPNGGHGLLGIRERVLLEAGTIDVRREGGDFVVEATLPTGTDAGVMVAITAPDEVVPSGAEDDATGAAGPARASGEETA